MTDPIVWESFSTRETVPARAAAEIGGSVEAIVGSATIAPSVQSQLLAPEWSDKIRVFDVIGDLPYRKRGPVLIFLETEHDAALADEVRRYYPAAAWRPIGAPNSRRTLVEEILLEPEVLTAQRGLAAAYVGADGTRVDRREPAAELSASSFPVRLPSQVHWRLGVALDRTGTYAFRVPNGFRLGIDDLVLPDESGRVELARGNHVIEVQGTLNSDGTLLVAWQPPEATEWRTVDRSALFVAPEGGHGLEATFYPTRTWEGSPRESLIDPILDHYYHLSPFRRLNFEPPAGWSVEWRGSIDVPTGGTYRFDVERISRAGLWIDERLVFDDTGDDSAEVLSGTLDLTAGRHQIRARLQNRSAGGPRLYLYWTPPGGRREVVPGRALYPPPPSRAP
jgi:hypothetical protein